MTSEGQKALIGLCGLIAAAWGFVGSVWIAQALLARHGYVFNAWHIAGYVTVWQILTRPMSAELAYQRIRKLLEKANPSHDALTEYAAFTIGQALVVTVAYAVVRSL